MTGTKLLHGVDLSKHLKEVADQEDADRRTKECEVKLMALLKEYNCGFELLIYGKELFVCPSSHHLWFLFPRFLQLLFRHQLLIQGHCHYLFLAYSITLLTSEGRRIYKQGSLTLCLPLSQSFYTIQ